MRLLTFGFCMILSHFFAQNTNLSGGLIFEGEPFIALNPNDNQHLVVAWMGFKLGEKVVIKTKVTFNGGQTWSATSSLPHLIPTNNSADPSVRFDNNGNVFVCFVDYDNDNFLNGSIVVVKSVNGGVSWQTPVEALNINQCPNQLCVDRPWMVIDNSGLSLDGTIYITTMPAGQPLIVTPPYHPYLVVSTDSGNSFGDVRFLDTTNYQAGSLIDKPMPTPTVSSDGRFLAVYPSYVVAQSVFAQNFLVSSVDGGFSLTHSLVNQASQGFSETSTKKGPLLIASKNNPSHYAFLQLSEMEGDLDVFLMETFDAGISWSGMIRVNDDQIGNGVLQDLVWADFNESGDLVVCWRDRRNGGIGFASNSDIYAAVKFRDSINFSQNFPITDITIPHDPMLESSGNDFMSIVYSGDTIHAVWGDVRNGVINIFYNKMSVLDPVLNISTISTSDWSLKSIYPNPAQQFIYLDDQFVGYKYQIISSEGKVLENGVLTTNGFSVADLDSGKFMVVIESEKKLFSYSFVKMN